jgi:hypothetical protein
MGKLSWVPTSLFQKEVYMKYVVFCLVALFLVGSLCISAHAADLGKAKATTDNIRQSDPPQVSTTTKPSPVGQPVSDYKPPAAKSLKVKEPPPPPTK